MSGPPIMFGRALVSDLVRRAAALTGVDESDLTGQNRDMDVRLTRFALMRVAHDAGRTHSQIARVLHLHHTTVAHGVWRSYELEGADEDFAELLAQLRQPLAKRCCPACLRPMGADA